MRTSGSTPPRSSSMSPTWANCRRPTGSPSRQAPSGRRGSGAVGSTWLVAARSLVAESPVWPVPAVPGRARRRVLCVRWVTVIGVLLGPRACTHPGTGRPGLHPGHPTAKEGCRPASRGLSLVLMTCSNHTRGLTERPRAVPRHGLAEPPPEPVLGLQLERTVDRDPGPRTVAAPPRDRREEREEGGRLIRRSEAADLLEAGQDESWRRGVVPLLPAARHGVVAGPRPGSRVRGCGGDGPKVVR